MLFLHSNGVGTSRAVRIYKTYGADAVQLISENPYRLARDIRGIGFRTADQIAAKLGIEKTAMIRVRAGISCALAEAMDEGHCGLPAEELVALTEKLLEGRLGWSTRRWALNSTMVLSLPTISKTAIACFSRRFTEPSTKSLRSSRRSLLESRLGQ